MTYKERQEEEEKIINNCVDKLDYSDRKRYLYLIESIPIYCKRLNDLCKKWNEKKHLFNDDFIQITINEYKQFMGHIIQDILNELIRKFYSKFLGCDKGESRGWFYCVNININENLEFITLRPNGYDPDGPFICDYSPIGYNDKNNKEAYIRFRSHS